MSLATNKLDQIIAECQSRISTLKQELIQIEAELNGYLIAKDTMIRAGIGQRRIEVEGSGRSLSETWSRVLAFIGSKKGAGASIDEIVDFTDQAHIKISRPSIRSQLSIYTNKDFLHRVAGGLYQLTEKGYELVKQPDNNQPSEPHNTNDSNQINHPSQSIPSPSNPLEDSTPAGSSLGNWRERLKIGSTHSGPGIAAENFDKKE
ncbi:MAG: hypothetical protein Q8L53_11210 [Aestuariivirga sp.]|nr:hypothetical protein [Aestuariivirga sp.]